jgi:hypothetical protein
VIVQAANGWGLEVSCMQMLLVSVLLSHTLTQSMYASMSSACDSMRDSWCDAVSSNLSSTCDAAQSNHRTGDGVVFMASNRNYTVCGAQFLSQSEQLTLLKHSCQSSLLCLQESGRAAAALSWFPSVCWHDGQQGQHGAKAQAIAKTAQQQAVLCLCKLGKYY